jgi:ATP-dependent RNA helicase DeaD
MTDTPSFASLSLREGLLRALEEVGYTHPTPVQHAVLPHILEGRDVLVQSRTGSGKTAAFAIPLIERAVRVEGGVQVLALCPTRELALQVATEFERLGRHMGIKVAAVYGGASMPAQVKALEDGAQVVVGTPGRVLDHLRRGTLKPVNLRAFVLDEGDEMLSMGFAEELNAIIEQLPKNRQGVILSATMPDSIQRIAQRHLKNPEFVALSSDSIAPSELTHIAYFSAAGPRVADLARVFELEQPDAAIVFCNTKAETEQVARGLKELGLKAEFLNGDLAQGDRERVLDGLREERVKFLIATDVAARGIDVPHLSHVVHFGFPEQPENYVHRSGRTGRAGRKGCAVSLVGPHDIGNLYFLRLTYGIRPIERNLPSERELTAQREQARLEAVIRAAELGVSDEARALARRLLTAEDPEGVVGSLLARFFFEEAQRPAKPAPQPERRERTERPRVERPRPEPRADVRPEPRPESRPEPRLEPRADVRPEPRVETRVEAAVAAEVEVAAPLEERPRRERTERPRRERSPRPMEGGEESVAVADPTLELRPKGDIRLAVGRREGVRPGDVLRLLCDIGGVARADIGRINIRERSTFVGVPADDVDAVLARLADARFNDAPVDAARPRPRAPEGAVEGEVAAAEAPSA